VKVKAVSLEVGADFGRDVKPADRKSTLRPFSRALSAEVVHLDDALSAGYDEDIAGRISDTQVPVDLNGPLTVSILLGQ